MFRLFKFVLLSILIATSPTLSVAQTGDTVVLSPPQMRELAAQSIVGGQPQQAYALASALLQRNPNDIEALIIRARAARDLGRFTEAKHTARRAWQKSRNSNEKFASSMVMAQALSSAGARTRSQLWLRRAAQHAPDERMKNIAVRDFQYVRRINPWATELSFSVSPDSNINNGSQRSSTQLFDLPFEFQLSGAARALSGIQFNSSIATRYRLAESQRSQHDLVLQLSHRTYTMSDEAKRLAPTAKGSDFAFSTSALSYVRRGFSSADTNLPNEFSATIGRTWYGGDPFMQYARLGFTQNVVLSRSAFVFGGVSLERQQSLSQRQDVSISGLSVGMRKTTNAGNRLTLAASGKVSKSNDVTLDYQQLTLSARYALGKPVAGMRIDFGIQASRKSHELSRFSRFGRQDDSLSIDATAVFKNIEFYGFSPSVTISARKTDSSIGLYDAQGYGVKVGIQSAF